MNLSFAVTKKVRLWQDGMQGGRLGPCGEAVPLRIIEHVDVTEHQETRGKSGSCLLGTASHVLLNGTNHGANDQVSAAL